MFLDSVSETEQEEFEIRLVGGDTPMEGRLEVRLVSGGDWGTVCDDAWGPEDAAVVCRSLGYRYVKAPLVDTYGPGQGAIYLANMDCSGTEEALWLCPGTYWGQSYCLHDEDVGVTCSGACFVVSSGLWLSPA